MIVKLDKGHEIQEQKVLAILRLYRWFEKAHPGSYELRLDVSRPYVTADVYDGDLGEDSDPVLSCHFANDDYSEPDDLKYHIDLDGWYGCLESITEPEEENPA